jgi:putative transposase
MKALGYPCRATLTAWVREAFPKSHRAVVGNVGQRSYPAAFKQAAIAALCTWQESAQAVADELGVCRPTYLARHEG